jgi:hypothetical protein
MSNCTPSKISIDPSMQLQRKMGTWKVDLENYRSLEGSLIYLTKIRLNICFVVNYVNTFMDELEEVQL